jgi:hypothetical protein
MNIPKELLLEAVEASGAPTQTMAVILGLKELIRKKRLEELAALKGTNAITFSPLDKTRHRRFGCKKK